MDFPGVALVTGGASGIGKATALLYAEEGCKKIAIADVNAESLEKAKKEVESANPGVTVLPIVVDVRNQESVEAMVAAVVKEFGRVDYCCNSAGILRYGDTSILPVEDFDMVYQVNLRGVFLSSKAEINQMIKQEPLKSKDSLFPARGAIVNISSQAGLMGNPNLPAYVASKHGVIGLSKSDGQKFANQLIRVNALCPGTIETPMLGEIPTGEAGKKREAERNIEIATGRLGVPKELAQCIVFLTSGRASFVTGTFLAANGGFKGH